jgi:hypothetical protein
MKSFTDNAGRSWVISVNVGTIKQVRALCEVDLANIISMEPGKPPNVEVLEKLADDPVLLVDVLYAACKEEADQKKISDVDFGRAMAGDTIEMATAALLDEIVDFFPEGKRRILQKVLGATRRFREKSKAALSELLGDPTLDSKIDDALEQLTSSSTSSPESAQ